MKSNISILAIIISFLLLATCLATSCCLMLAPPGNQNVQKKACPSGWGVVVVASGGEVGPRQDEGSSDMELTD